MTSVRACKRISFVPFPAALTGVLVLLVEKLVNLVTNLAIWDLDIVLGGTVVGHEGKETVVSDIELTNQVSGISSQIGWRLPTSWYSRRETFGTSILWVDGDRSSIFLLVKMSMATMWTLA